MILNIDSILRSVDLEFLSSCDVEYFHVQEGFQAYWKEVERMEMEMKDFQLISYHLISKRNLVFLCSPLQMMNHLHHYPCQNHCRLRHRMCSFLQYLVFPFFRMIVMQKCTSFDMMIRFVSMSKRQYAWCCSWNPRKIIL